MLRRNRIEGPSVSGLRTRYFPKNRIGHGLIGMAPWLDLVLLMVFFMMFDARMVVQPGISVDLPRASYRGATHGALRLVVLSIKAATGPAREEIVFFDHVRYIVRNADQMKNLRAAIAENRRGHPEAELILEADRSVRHGTVVNLMNLALDAGFKRVNIAERLE